MHTRHLSKSLVFQSMEEIQWEQVQANFPGIRESPFNSKEDQHDKCRNFQQVMQCIGATGLPSRIGFIHNMHGWSLAVTDYNEFINTNI